jgi:hypothetical protein
MPVTAGTTRNRSAADTATRGSSANRFTPRRRDRRTAATPPRPTTPDLLAAVQRLLHESRSARAPRYL